MPQEEPSDARPFLAIPYWSPGDTGESRPLPGSVAWYLAGGIRTSTYQPGELLEVAVDVRNIGGSNAPSLAQVTVWWSDPSLGFLIRPENLIGFRQVPVPPRGGATTTPLMARRMPADAPDHICLIARISHPLDPAPSIPDPVNDRHWAQRNLSVIAMPAGTPARLTFQTANPRSDTSHSRLRIAPALDPRLLGSEDGVTGDGLVDIFPIVTLDGEPGEGVFETEIVLEPGEAREFALEIDVPQLEPGQFAALEISQSSDERVIGGLGVVLVAQP